MKKGLTTAAVVLVVGRSDHRCAQFVGVGGSKKTINIGVFLASSANTYWEAELLGAKDIAAKNPNVKLTVFDAKFTTNTQVSQLRDALVSKKYQAWFVGPERRRAVDADDQAGDQAGRQGRLLARAVRAEHPGRQRADPGPGDLRRPRLLSQRPVARTGRRDRPAQNINPCKVLWLPGLPTLPLEVARQDGLYSVIKSHSNIKVVAIAAGGYLAAPALTATSNILRAHPDLNVVVSSGDQMIAGAVKAEKLAGKTGNLEHRDGCTFEAKQLILHGQGERLQRLPADRTEGRLVVQALVDAVNGSTKTGIYVNPDKYSPIGVSARRPTSRNSLPSSIHR